MSMTMEYYENHQKEYEEQQRALAEATEGTIFADDPVESSTEELHNALIFELRDAFPLFTAEQKELVKQIVFEENTTPKERVCSEAAELRDKIDKLETFLRKRNLDGIKIIEEMKLTDAAVYLLYKQLDAMKEYPIVRVFDWVKKVLMNFVHEVALENWDPYNSPKNLKAKIQEFLNQYKGFGNLFQNYEIGEPRQDPVTKQITCDIILTPFYAAKNFVIKVAADKKNKEASLAGA